MGNALDYRIEEYGNADNTERLLGFGGNGVETLGKLMNPTLGGHVSKMILISRQELTNYLNLNMSLTRALEAFIRKWPSIEFILEGKLDNPLLEAAIIDSQSRDLTHIHPMDTDASWKNDQTGDELVGVLSLDKKLIAYIFRYGASHYIFNPNEEDRGRFNKFLRAAHPEKHLVA